MDGTREFRLLSRAESLELLATAWVGRVVLSADAPSVAFPVSYALDGEAVVFHSGPGLKLSAAEDGAVVTFEVDDFDAALRIGWSVMVTGTAHRLSDPADVERVAALELPTWLDPGAEGAFVLIDATVVSGRRVTPTSAGG